MGEALPSEWPVDAPEGLLRSLACFMPAHQTLDGLVMLKVGWMLVHGELYFTRRRAYNSSFHSEGGGYVFL